MKRTLVPLVLILAACDPTPPPQPETGRKPNPVFETQIQSVGKARAVEGLVMDAAGTQRRQTEEVAEQLGRQPRQ